MALKLATGAIGQGEYLRGNRGSSSLARIGQRIARAASSDAGEGPKTAPWSSSLGGGERRDVVAAHAVLAHLGDEGKLELLFHEAAEEAAHRMRLPTGLGDDLLDA